MLLLHFEDGTGGYLTVEEQGNALLLLSTEESSGGACTMKPADVARLVEVLGAWLLATPLLGAKIRAASPPPPSRGEDD